MKLILALQRNKLRARTFYQNLPRPTEEFSGLSRTLLLASNSFVAPAVLLLYVTLPMAVINICLNCYSVSTKLFGCLTPLKPMTLKLVFSASLFDAQH